MVAAIHFNPISLEEYMQSTSMSPWPPNEVFHYFRPPPSGTFVTVDICLQQALAEGFVDVPAVVRTLRRQRAGAVQMSKQYAFIHDALVSRLTGHHHDAAPLANGTVPS